MFYRRRDCQRRDRFLLVIACDQIARSTTPARIIMSSITTSITARAQIGPEFASTDTGSEASPCRARASRRQLNHYDGCMPMRRAIAETLASGSIASATARSLKA